jgi:thiol-disulfide isomerase/thioredoxin
MQRLRLGFGFLALTAVAAETAPAALEKEIADLVAGPQVTVVHLWAPWCPNCRAEMTPDGWARFIGSNPDTKFVFVNVWHGGDAGEPLLAKSGLGPQLNLLLRLHPNGVRKGAERMTTFLGQAVDWLPSTWIYKDGKLRYALNYGEVRFPMLRQLIADSRDKWEHR